MDRPRTVILNIFLDTKKSLSWLNFELISIEFGMGCALNFVMTINTVLRTSIRLTVLTLLILSPHFAFANRCVDYLSGEVTVESVGIYSVEKNVDRNLPNTEVIDGIEYKKISEVDLYKFEDVRLDSNTGRSEVVEFDVPADAVSFSVNLRSILGGDYTYIYRLTDPSGKEIISPNPEVSPEVRSKVSRGQMVSDNAALPGALGILSSTLVPNTPNVKVIPGKWKIEVAREMVKGREDPGKREMSILLKREKPRPVNLRKRVGVFQLNLHLFPGNSLGQASQFAKDTILNGPLRKFRDFFRDMGVEVKVNTIKDADPRVADADVDQNGANQSMGEALKTTAEDNQINVFFLAPSNYHPSGLSPINCAGFCFNSSADINPTVLIRAAKYALNEVTAHEHGHGFALQHTNRDHLKGTQSLNNFVEPPGNHQSNFMNARGIQLSAEADQIFVIRINPALATYEKID